MSCFKGAIYSSLRNKVRAVSAAASKHLIAKARQHTLPVYLLNTALKAISSVKHFWDKNGMPKIPKILVSD